MTDKLRGEWPGILNWLLAGCRAWQDTGLNAPLEVVSATADYQNEQDFLAEFFDACCIFTKTAETPRADLFERYIAWSTRTKDHHPLDRTSFFERIRRRPRISEARRRVDGRLTRLFSGIALSNTEVFQP